MLLLILRKLYLIFFSISDNVLAHQLFEFVSILQVWILAHHTINSVVVQILPQLFQIRSDFWIHCFLLLILLRFSRWLTCFLQKLSILFFDDYSCIGFESKIFIWPDDHSLYDVLFQLRKSKHGRDG